MTGPRSRSTRILSAFLGCLLVSPWCYAQTKSEAELKMPAPENLSLETTDGVSIRCTYYPGGFVEPPAEKDKKDKPRIQKKTGKEVVPIIMLHGWDGQRREFDELATGLQKLGHAIVVPDLRGHGDSTNIRLPNGDTKPIDRARLRSSDIEAMSLDVEAIKKFLLEKNNAGEVNIEQLCVIGADVGGIVAVNWAAYDWSRQQLPAFKQGRDVKALVLISPQQSYRGYTLNKALQHPVVRSNLSLMLIVGEADRSAASDAKSIHGRIEKFHPDPGTDPEERLKKQDLFYLKPDTSLQGTQLLRRAAGLPINNNIALFIELRLVRRASEFPWSDRTNPLSGS